MGDWLRTLRLPDDWRQDIERMQRGIARVATTRPAVDDKALQGKLERLKDLYYEGDITREEWVGRKRELTASLETGWPQPTYGEAVLVKAARLLQDLSELWDKATPAERSDIAQELLAEVVVKDKTIVRIKPARDEYLPLLAAATAREGLAERPRTDSNRRRRP